MTHHTGQIEQISTSKGYFDNSAIMMLFFGFAAGIPILLIFSSLSLWLREAGIDRATVTMFSWAALGYSFKFIWSPLIDTLPVPVLTRKFGRRRAWILTAQIGIIIAIILMAMTNPATGSTLIMAAAAVLLGFTSATQDIVIDAYRIESAPTPMQPILSAMYTAGYRIGMIVAGAGALYLADLFGSTEEAYNYTAWQYTYLIMAAVMLIGVLTTLVAKEPSAVLETDAKKIQNTTLKFAKYYSFTLIPLALFGLWYLFINLSNSLFEAQFATASIIISTLKFYIIALFASVPIVIVWLLAHQPAIHSQVIAIKSDNNDYLKLTLTFLGSVVCFVLTFVFLGKILPETNGVFVGFIMESLRLLLSLVGFGGCAFVIAKSGFINADLIKNAWISPIADFFERYGKVAILLLLLIGFYRVSDIVAGVISNVFYQDMGFSKTDIANAVKLVGVVISILGGFLGGLLALKTDIIKSMMIGAILACTTNLLFVLLSFHVGEIGYLYLAVILDNLAGGFASAVFIAFLSALTSIRFTAVQYALFSSLMTLFPKVLGGYSGSIVEATSYPIFFTITFVIGLPILVLIYLVGKKVNLSKVQLAD